MIKILFIGDIYGKTGRNAVRRFLPIIKEKHDLDLVIANGENSTHGKGMSKKVYDELMDIGVDAFTMGNHFLDKKDIINWVDTVNNVVRPANVGFTTPGKGSIVLDTKKGKVRLTNLIGRIFIKEFDKGNPFDVIDSIIENSEEKIHIVDMHAEATSEKRSLSYYVDGRVSAVLGTHTHIQTADERILTGGTATISDVGFCGAYESVLGINISGAIEYCKAGYSKNTSPAEGEEEFNGVVLEIDITTGKTKSIKRVNLRPDKKEGI